MRAARAGRDARGRTGFTLVEVLLAATLLAVTAASVAAVFMAGSRTLSDSDGKARFQSALRSKMEELVGTPFASLAGGSNTVTVGTEVSAIAWTVVPMDMDGDGVDEPDARIVTVTLGGESLRMIRVDPRGRLRKL